MKRRRLERSGSACNISRCLSVDLYRVGYAEAVVNTGQHPCSARRKRRRLASAKEPVDAHIRFPDVNAGQLFCSLQLLVPAFGGIPTMLKPVIRLSSFWLRTSRRKTWSSFEISDPILRIFSPTFVLCFSNPRALFAVAFLRQFPSFSVVVLLVRGSVGLLSRSSSILYHSWRLLLARARSRCYCLGRVFAVSR
ncbi:hypothetical protein F511_08865 [Dorcoceras hygrometricum]|uniref:Uncharacterized protein n=1 Tax=Dorcoceras hygrometricum TaxID=472368 RepID=A0A2Z7AM73_9LAMI|nr:hypothetical protein F511_08865 [Dorcoceras hygrometricum]